MTLSSKFSDSSEATNLKGKRVVVTAYDLEQSEHRGIAVYSKALIRTLKEEGADVWLLTEFDFPMKAKGFRRLPKEMQSILQSAKVLNSLVEGGEEAQAPVWLKKKCPKL